MEVRPVKERIPARDVALDDTSACPLYPNCETCGASDPTELAVWPVDTGPLGVACVTLCGDCDPPRWSLPHASRRVLAHCEHLGVDVDEAAAALEADR
jgi:hypothetical protein